LLVGVNKPRLDWDGLTRVLDPGRAGEGSPVPPPPSAVLILDAAVNLDDLDEALFHWCANSDPARDLLGDHAGHGPRPARLIVDATVKSPGESRHGLPARGWPPILRMTEEVRALVDRRWGEYGLG
jgi:4-hydroxy-3-polyprenylbenzoate decarboxylase